MARIAQDIERCYAEIGKRGGVFMSRDRIDSSVHVKIRGILRTAKVHGMRMVESFQQALQEARDGVSEDGVLATEQEIKLVEDAVKTWDDKMEALWVVPGERYVEEKLSEEEKKWTVLMLVDLEKVVLALMEAEGMRDIPPRQLNILLANEDDDDDDDGEKTTKDLGEQFKQQQEISSHLKSKSNLPEEASTPSPRRSILKTRKDSTFSPQPSPAASSNQTPQAQTPTPLKRVKTAQFASIFPTEPLPPTTPTNTRQEPLLLPHRQTRQFFGGEARPMGSYWRPSMTYNPGIWSSFPPGQILDTSLYRKKWEDMEDDDEWEDAEEGCDDDKDGDDGKGDARRSRWKIRIRTLNTFALNFGRYMINPSTATRSNDEDVNMEQENEKEEAEMKENRTDGDDGSAS